MVLIFTPERIAAFKAGVADEELGLRQEHYIDVRTKEAELGEQPPTLVPSDASLEDIATSMSWDFSAGWEQRRGAQIRKLRARRKRFRPAAIRPLPGGGFEHIYPYGDFDLAVFREGLCCVRCHHWKHEDPIQHIREHEELQRQLHSMQEHGTPPSGVPLKDLCAFCGNNLDHQKRTDVEAA